MKQKLIYLIALLLSGFANPSKAAVDPGIILRGEFLGDNEKHGSKVSVFYYENYYGISSPYIKYNIQVVNGEFECRIKNVKQYAYVLLMYGMDDNNKMIRTVTSRFLRGKLYLLSSGSEINIAISDNEVSFKGPGAALMKCQYELYQSGYITSYARAENGGYYDSAAKIKQQLDSLYFKQLIVLKHYRSEIGEFPYSILKSDFDADRNVYFMYLDFNSSDDKSAQRNKDILRFYIEHYLFKERDTSDLPAKAKSRSYGEYLLKKSINDTQLSMLASSKKVRLSFDQICEKINEEFAGMVREKLLTACFLDYFQKKEVPDLYLDRAIESMRITEYRNILLNIKSTRGVGKPAFNFSLPDSSGKIYTQEMLKGKVVILDFWFTGCHGCASLTKKMMPVYQHFKDNPNLLFVSISIDKKLDVFRKSLKNGGYSHPGNLDLYTGGNGTEDPVVKYYNVISYPTVIIVGTDSKILTSSPPLPYTSEASARLISLLQSYLP